MNISTAHQHDTKTDRMLTLKNTEVQTASSTFMVKHNIRTVNHREIIVHLKWFIPYPTEINVL